MTLYQCAPEKQKLKHFFVLNDNYARAFVCRSGHTISDCHKEAVVSGKFNRRANRHPHSAAKKRTFKSNYSRIYIEKTSGTPYFFTLKPLCNVEPEVFKKAMKGLTRLLRSAGAEYIYMLEWAAHEQTPHIHLVSNIPGETIADLEAFAERIISYWLRVMPKVINSRIKQDVRAVYDSGKLFSYMSKQNQNEFNDRAIATGKDWSVISVTGCSRGWEESSFEGCGVSKEAYMESKRWMKADAKARGVKLRKQAKGCDSETKRAISEVSSFTKSGLSREESWRFLAHVNASCELKELRFLREMMERYRRGHYLASQEEKDEVDRLLLTKGYDMRHMYPQWEKPKMSMAERYKTEPVYRLLRKAINELRQIKGIECFC